MTDWLIIKLFNNTVSLNIMVKWLALLLHIWLVNSLDFSLQTSYLN